MTDFRQLSRLPEDERYWDGLEARLMADLGPRVRSRADRRPVPWAPLARRAGILSGLAGAAGLAALLFVPARSMNAEANPAGLLRLSQDDPIVHAFLSAPAPPALALLVLPPTVRDRDD